MKRTSHIAVATVNVFTLLWSIFVILQTTYKITSGSVDCNMGFPVEVLVYAIVTFILSIVALAGAIHANRRLLLIYTWGMVGCIVLLLGFSAFMFGLSKASTAQTSKHQKDIKLSDYPSWLRTYAVDGDRWIPIKKCMVREQICKMVPQKKRDESGDLWIEDVTLQHGCCEPPLRCSSVNQSDISWELPVSQEKDCNIWRNRLGKEYCYDCTSCKAGYMRRLKEKWLSDAKRSVVFCLFVIISVCLALWAFLQAPNNKHSTDAVAAI